MSLLEGVQGEVCQSRNWLVPPSPDVLWRRRVAGSPVTRGRAPTMPALLHPERARRSCRCQSRACPRRARVDTRRRRTPSRASPPTRMADHARVSRLRADIARPAESAPTTASLARKGNEIRDGETEIKRRRGYRRRQTCCA